MRKLINGIVEFRRNKRSKYIEDFSKLAAGQSPDTLFIACSDSRVVPNTFASTNPGDLFVFRNIGNIIPKCSVTFHAGAGASELATLEFALQNLEVKDIIVCGHSDCGAMKALVEKQDLSLTPGLNSWLKHAESSVEKYNQISSTKSDLSDINKLSQINVLQQMENLRSYPLVKEKLNNGSLQLHGWWFDIAQVDVYAYESGKKNFVLIDEAEAKALLRKVKS